MKTVIIVSFCILWASVTSSDAYVTPPVWDATQTTFMDGKLIYRGFNVPIAPGMNNTCRFSKDLAVESYENLRDTFLKSPEIFKTIYDSGLIENYLEYQVMVSKNWNFAMLAKTDFADAQNAYIAEGNWGVLQVLYYVLKGNSRLVWALAILNSGEAVYKIGQAGVETVYYLLEYPVGGILEGAAAPVVFIGGTAWSSVASTITTGWALPATSTLDVFIFTGGLVWPEP